MKSLAILFAGEKMTATLLDGSEVGVFVRRLPEAYLLDQFLSVMEFGTPTVQLCCYIRAGEGEPPKNDHPEVAAPTGYWLVPQHWAHSLSDESLAALYELAKQLNFQRAEKLAQGRLSAKKQIGPLERQIVARTLTAAEPLLEAVTMRSATLFASMLNTPPSPAPVESSASSRPSSGRQPSAMNTDASSS